MDPTTALDRLVDSGVLAETAEGVTLSAAFAEARSRERTDVETLDDDAVADALDRISVAGVADAGPDSARGLLATHRALEGRVDGLPDGSRARLAPVVQQFEATPSNTDGTPEPFTSVAGANVVPLLRACERAVLYVWTHDCEPCEYQRAVLAELFADPPEDVALLSVYGPDADEAMAAYDVPGAPALLFLADGTVDSRLYGGQHGTTVEAEVEKLRETAALGASGR